MKRTLLFLAGCALLGLAACSSTGGGVPLSVVQAESNAITTAVNTLAPALIKDLPSPKQADATAAVAALDAANTTLQAATASSSPIADVQAVVNLAGTITNELPLPANTELAINAGIVLVNAFLGALPAATPAAVGANLAEPGIVPGPIPIPLN